VTRPIFILKLQSIRGDSIRTLRAILKQLLRRHGFRCVSAIELPTHRDAAGLGGNDASPHDHAQARSNTMRKNEAYPSKYFKASDQSDGWTLTAEVEVTRLEKLSGSNGNGETEKLVVYFRKLRSGLVIGPTVFDQFVAATGEEDSNDWKGHTVELYRDSTTFAGKRVPCIRVRKPSGEVVKKSAKKLASASAELDGEMPF
jgi:hypothetical protein